ncbi:hypothetical protein PAEPH01_0571 [Pancytospora epiphaga]|nr:hypothetical protein PAEPH01_0571 [Pancytospora epiphaga]
MVPLSQRLNMRYSKIAVLTEHGMHTTNHLLFVDNLKLFAESDKELKAMTEDT